MSCSRLRRIIFALCNAPGKGVEALLDSCIVLNDRMLGIVCDVRDWAYGHFCGSHFGRQRLSEMSELLCWC